MALHYWKEKEQQEAVVQKQRKMRWKQATARLLMLFCENLLRGA